MSKDVLVVEVPVDYRTEVRGALTQRVETLKGKEDSLRNELSTLLARQVVLQKQIDRTRESLERTQGATKALKDICSQLVLRKETGELP